MKMFLVRHATATDRIGGLVRSDEERPLTETGKKEAHLVASFLRQLGVQGDYFLYSPLVRTRQTAEIFAEILAGKDNLRPCNALAPGGSIDELFRELKKLKRADEVLLFGHEPDVAELAQSLLVCRGELQMPFKKSSVCRIDVSDLPPTTPGTLKWFVPPKLVQALSNH